MRSIFKQQVYTSSSGKKYTLQHPGVRTAANITDTCKDRYGNPMESKLAPHMMKTVIVSPKLTWDSFGSDKKEFNEVITVAYSFLQGEDVGDLEDIDSNVSEDNDD